MDIEKECTLLGNLFHHIVTDLKSSSPAWEDFVSKGTKLHGLLKSVTLALFAFTESIQKIADLATNTKGSTKDVGSALTRICVRQKMVENKLKQFTSSLMDNLICPVQERLEEWKKVSTQLEKDHSKDYKKATQEIKKRNSDTIRLQKKARKGSKSDFHKHLNSVMHDVNERFAMLAETEKSALRNLLVEERSRICFFANCLAPVLSSQVSVLNEASHLNDLSGDMSQLCRNPKQLPTSTEQLVQDYIAAHCDQSSTFQDSQQNGFLDSTSPPSTPTSDNSRKSSICSLTSLTSSDSVSSGSLNRSSSLHQRRYQGHHRRNSGTVFSGSLGSPSSCKSAPATGLGGPRLSISSHDSGFVSTGNGNAPQPFCADVTSKLPTYALPIEKTELTAASDVPDGSYPIIRGRSLSQQASGSLLHSTGQNRFSWKDWEKPGPYDRYPTFSKHETAREVLPSKVNQAPPILTPKPTSYCQRFSAAGDAVSHKIPLHRANTAPVFRQLRTDESLPPPPSDLLPPSNTAEETLPPPPPSLLGDNDDTLPLPVQSVSSAATSCIIAPTHPYTPPSSDFAEMRLNRKNSLNSLQYSTSSGYCSQYSTPTCSEDTIPSQDADLGVGDDLYYGNRYQDQNFSTIPRTHQQGNRSKTLPRGGLHRHASTNGLPSKTSVTNDIEEAGTATIRRKPTSKSFRRTTSGPKAVVPPTVPVYSNTPSISTYPYHIDVGNTNYNNNNKKLGENDVAEHFLAKQTLERRNDSVSRDLTLLFQQSSDHHVLDSPTPTSTPVLGDSSRTSDAFNAAMPQTPRSACGHD